MASALPERPDLELEKKQAKSLLKAYRAGDPDAARRMHTHLPRLEAADSRATLADAQFVLARERGFDSWPKLKAHIESRRPLRQQIVQFVRAACNGRPAAAARLLTQNPAIVSHSVHAACAAANADAVAAMLARDPDLVSAEQPDLGGKPLVYACASHMHKRNRKLAAGSRRCVQLLLDHGADPNSYTQLNPRDPKSRLSVLYRACVSDNPGAVELLLQRGAKANDGESVYHAAELNHRQCLELLLAAGAEISARQEPWGNTILYFVAEVGGSTDGIHWLLEHGADPNVTSGPSNETPLHRAAAAGRAEVVDLLLAFGAEPNIERADGRTSYVLAVRSGREAVQQRLRDAGAHTGGVTTEDRFIGACMRADQAEALALLEARPQMAAALTEEDKAQFVQEAGNGRADIVKLMATMGFDFSWEHPEGGTAMHWAAWRGQPEIVHALLALGAPINVRDRAHGSSPIAWAAHGSAFCRKADVEYCAIVDSLIDAGAEYAPSINGGGEPPQSFASRRVRARLIARGFVPRDG